MNTAKQREMWLSWIDSAVAEGARQHKACQVLGFSQRTIQRWRIEGNVLDKRTQSKHSPPHKLSEMDRKNLIAIANSEEFAHLPPNQIVPILADRGLYFASESTFYRVLRQEDQLTHRRSERPTKPNHKPKAICAIKPNQLYSWDITYLPTMIKGMYLYLYVFIDIFSRKIVGWQVYDEESSENASQMIKDICLREGVRQNQVTLHSDNGSPMKGATMLAMLQTLGVMPSLSRPSVSNDNPYSESAFKTLKYRPNYPLNPFTNLLEARRWVEKLVYWYNEEHRHSGIQYVTPSQRHAGKDKALIDNRLKVYQAAMEKNPSRWSGGRIRSWKLIEEVHLNPTLEANRIKKQAA